MACILDSLGDVPLKVHRPVIVPAVVLPPVVKVCAWIPVQVIVLLALIVVTPVSEPAITKAPVLVIAPTAVIGAFETPFWVLNSWLSFQYDVLSSAAKDPSLINIPPALLYP